MVQQWFLDLDGVRSGPYQTPEVLGLIAEGEVLPHHRISTHLKDDPWITVLEWRLEQAKGHGAPTEKKSYIPETAGENPKPAPQAKPTPEIKWTGPDRTSSPFTQLSPTNEVKAVDLEAKPDEIEEVIQTLQAATPSAPLELKLEKLETPVHPPAATASETASAQEPTPNLTPTPAPAAANPTQKKRDPMAEMFDLVQTSKQKREAKERQHRETKETAHASKPIGEIPQASSGNLKMIVMSILIILAGFILGQLFQQSSTDDAPKPVAQEKNITAPAPETLTNPTQTEVIDRSTEKMTIRAQVERPVAIPTITPRFAPRIYPEPKGEAKAPELNPQELEELKDLKKELQELKALKEELKSNGGSPMMPPEDAADIPLDENYLTNPEDGGGAIYNPNDPGNPEYPQGYPGQNGGSPQPPVNY